ncbi:MAG: hypothetical protein LZF60_70075 [Nitrospira sp.]|nr:MAG: hypothetical protein LZF60_70075 [Nitrospira sp.]
MLSYGVPIRPSLFTAAGKMLLTRRPVEAKMRQRGARFARDY